MAVTTFDSVLLTRSDDVNTGSGTITSVGDVFTCSVTGGFDDVPVGSEIHIDMGEQYTLIEKTSSTVGIVDRTPTVPYSSKEWIYFFPALATTEIGNPDKLMACVSDKYTYFNSYGNTPSFLLDSHSSRVVLRLADNYLLLDVNSTVLTQGNTQLLLGSNDWKLDLNANSYVSCYNTGDFKIKHSSFSFVGRDTGDLTIAGGLSAFTDISAGGAKLQLGKGQYNEAKLVAPSGASFLAEGTTGKATVSSTGSGDATVTAGGTGDVSLSAGTTNVTVVNDGSISFNVEDVPGALLIDGTTGVVYEAIKEAVSLRTSYISVVQGVITTIPFASTVFDCASNISVANNTFTPKADGIYSIDINLTSYHTVAIPTGGAYVICQMYESGTTPAIDMAYGSSLFYDPAPACAKTVSLSWTADLEADTAYKFFFYHNNSSGNFAIYAGTTTIDSSIRISRI